ncbi:MAG: winged helix-turn-helix domain-containing protein, partial [Betaproteobacteria bacterium]|nr:winged helix-turn-helix domain-containing protein [Betaproteobacteria bacterium]
LTKVRYKRKLKVMEGIRRQGMSMLKRGLKQADVARKLEVSRQTVSVWNKVIKSNPIQPWRGNKLGRPRRMDNMDKISLSSMVRRGAERFGYKDKKWTLERIAKVYGNNDGKPYSKTYLSRILREMGFTCKKPSSDNLKLLKRWEIMRWIPLRGSFVGSERVEYSKYIAIENSKRRKSSY